MGIMAGIGGAVGGLAGLFGGGANNVQMPPQFNMPNMGAAAGNAFSGIGGLSNWTNMATAGQAPMGQTFSNLYNNPYASGFQQGAGVASNMGQNAALGAYNTGGNIIGMGQSMIPGAQAVLNTAFDPQQQLYQYLQNQNTQQSQANAAAAGLATSPYGVGLTNQSNQLFNMGWQNQQLGRQESGLGAFGQALGQAGQLQNLGTGIQNAAPGQYYGASALPYQTYGGIGQGQNQAIQSYFGNINSGMGIGNLPIQDYLSYLNTGNTANSVANQNAALQLQQQQQSFNQQMMLGGMLGGSLYGLGSMGMGGLGPLMGNFNMFNSGMYGSPGWGDPSMAEAARAGMASGLTYNPLTGSIG